MRDRSIFQTQCDGFSCEFLHYSTGLCLSHRESNEILRPLWLPCLLTSYPVQKPDKDLLQNQKKNFNKFSLSKKSPILYEFQVVKSQITLFLIIQAWYRYQDPVLSAQDGKHEYDDIDCVFGDRFSGIQDTGNLSPVLCGCIPYVFSHWTTVLCCFYR